MSITDRDGVRRWERWLKKLDNGGEWELIRAIARALKTYSELHAGFGVPGDRVDPDLMTICWIDALETVPKFERSYIWRDLYSAVLERYEEQNA